MATNADDATTVAEPAVDDSKIEEDLKKLKEEGAVDPEEEAEPPKTDESEEESETEEADGQTDDTPAFVKEFPNIKGDTPEEYAKNLEEAYKNSTSEALRLKRESEAPKEEEEDTGPVDPRLMYVDRIVNKDIQATFDKFQKDYPQFKDPVEYDKFTRESAALASYFIETKREILTAEELYPKVVSILGWEPSSSPDSTDKLNMAIKDNAASSKTTSATKTPSKSKVTDAEIAIYRQMNGSDKSDTEIRKELESFK